MKAIDTNSKEYQNALEEAAYAIQKTGDISEDIITNLLGEPPIFDSMEEADVCNEYATAKAHFYTSAFDLASQHLS